MGGLLSKNKVTSTESNHVPQSESRKRQKTSTTFWDGNPPLIPGLPDEISLAILARVSRICYLNFKAVSRSWKAAVTSPEIYKLRKELGTTEEWLYVLTKNQRFRFVWHAFDPVSKKWQKLPPVPNAYAKESYIKHLSGSRISIRIPCTIKGWIEWMNGADRSLFCGCTTGAVDGCLYMLGGFSRDSTMDCVWKYDPVSNSWIKVNSMSVGRAYVTTGVLNNKLFVVGGISIDNGVTTPLQSAEVYDPQTGLWSDLPSISFSKAHTLEADLYKPFAAGLISYNQKLYVLVGLCLLPDLYDVGGLVYDPETNSWVDMPTGMSRGWPIAGTKLSVNVDGDLYALGLSYSLTTAKLTRYNREDDSWKVVDEDVPVLDFKLETPCLVAGLLGKLHVITKDSNNNIVVSRVDKQNDLIASSGEGGTSEPCIWNVIASMNSDYPELVSCQSLDI